MIDKKSKMIFVICGVVLLHVPHWFSCSDMSFSADSAFFPYRTAGWFVLGSLMTIPFFWFVSGLMFKLTKWLPLSAAYGVMLLTTAVILVISLLSASPTSRLSRAVGEYVASELEIERLEDFYSMNDGRYMHGAFRGDKATVASLQTHRLHLKRQPDTHYAMTLFEGYFEDVDFPESSLIFQDDHGWFLIPDIDDRIYFIYRSQSSEEVL